ncbi:MAG: 3'-5' exonuclease [Bacteroidales bacterium]
MDELLHEIKQTAILFLDIETVPLYPSYIEVPVYERELWLKKSQRLNKSGETPSEVYKKAGIFAEFGKIICISVAYIPKKKNKGAIRVASFYGDDEKQILQDFSDLVHKHFNTPASYFCAHNGKEFDLPFIARRMLINGMKIPQTLDTRGKKPWDVQHIDTLDLWRFGDYKNYTSLSLLAHVFNIPTPKDDIDGSMVCDIYWNEGDIKRVVRYCQKDVVAVLQLFRKYCNMDCVADEDIVFVNSEI